jgi:16S rRNA (uracil1498-N3)-methyltransferase
MSTPTFHYPALTEDPAQLIHLHGKEAWHALGVRRLSVGDAIRVMDGHGRIAEGIVERMDGRHEAWLRVSALRDIPALQPDIVLASAIAKGDRQSTMLDMATQLGVSAYQPLRCARSVRTGSDHATERWQRICLEACKQSGSAWLPEILPVDDPVETVARAVAQGRQAILAHPDGAAIGGLAEADAITILIGPEGGFTTSEVDQMIHAGAVAVDLGRRVLRVETAAAGLIAYLRLSRACQAIP